MTRKMIIVKTYGWETFLTASDKAIVVGTLTVVSSWKWFYLKYRLWYCVALCLCCVCIVMCMFSCVCLVVHVVLCIYLVVLCLCCVCLVVYVVLCIYLVIHTCACTHTHASCSQALRQKATNIADADALWGPRRQLLVFLSKLFRNYTVIICQAVLLTLLRAFLLRSSGATHMCIYAHTHIFLCMYKYI